MGEYAAAWGWAWPEPWAGLAPLRLLSGKHHLIAHFFYTKALLQLG